MLVVHILYLLLGVVLGLLTIKKIHTFSLGELIDLSTGDANEKLLGKLVGDCLA